MRTIYKYILDHALVHPQTIQMPEKAEILSVQVQAIFRGRNEAICIWAMVETVHSLSNRQFVLVGTGFPCPDLKHSQHIGTVQLMDCSLVLHVFEVTNNKGFNDA